MVYICHKTQFDFFYLIKALIIKNKESEKTFNILKLFFILLPRIHFSFLFSLTKLIINDTNIDKNNINDKHTLLNYSK